MYKFLSGLIVFLFLNITHAKPVTIAVSVTPLSAPVIVAQHKGFFSDQGLDVRLQQYIGGQRTAKAMLASRADLATSSEAVVMFSSFHRDDFYIVSTFVESDNDVKILTTSQSGIQSVSDLQNRRIGTITGASAHYFIDHTLLMNGVTTNGNNIIKINPEDTSKVLLKGEVDAVASWEPYIYMAKAELGNKAVIIAHDKMYTETFNLLTRKDFAKNNMVLIKKILLAMKQAINYINDNEDDAKEILVRFFKKDLQIINSLWADLNFSLSLRQSLLISLESEARWAMERGFVQSRKIPNYLDYLLLDPLTEVQPSAVTIIR